MAVKTFELFRKINSIFDPKKPVLKRTRALDKISSDLLSHFYAVPSALAGLTSLFGMGRGGTPPLKLP